MISNTTRDLNSAVYLHRVAILDLFLECNSCLANYPVFGVHYRYSSSSFSQLVDTVKVAPTEDFLFAWCGEGQGEAECDPDGKKGGQGQAVTLNGDGYGGDEGGGHD